MLLSRSCSVCVNADDIYIEERKIERDQRQGEKDKDREADTENQIQRKGESRKQQQVLI